jgi:uncharacterized protein (UPF0210 family)
MMIVPAVRGRGFSGLLLPIGEDNAMDFS